MVNYYIPRSILFLALASTANSRFLSGPFDNSDPISYNSLQIDVSLGTPAKKFQMMLDTNVAGMWIPHVDCKKNKNGPVCSHKQLYNPKESSSASESANTVNLSYRGDAFSASNATDIFSYLPEDGANIEQKVNFGLVTKLPSAYYNIFTDGVLGLGLNSPEGIESPFVQWVKKDNPQLPMVNIYYPKKEDCPTITIGKEDSDHCVKADAFERITPVKDRNWAFPVKVMFPGLKQTFSNYITTIDYTSDYMFVPQRVYDVIKRSGNITEDGNTRRLYASCNDDLRIIVQPLKTQAFHIYSSALTEDVGKGKCIYRIKPSPKPKQNEWKLGLPFLKETCAMFDFRGWVEFKQFKL